MRLVRFEPFGLSREMDRFLAEFGPRTIGPRTMRSDWAPRVDVLDSDNALTVRVEAPGVDPEDLDITVEGDSLVISGTRHFEAETEEGGYRRKEILEGKFTRTILLPEGVEVDEISAAAKEGIVTLTVPKSPEVLPRKVKVEVES